MRQLFRTWDFLQGHAIEDYDSLINKLFQLLNKGTDEEKLAAVLSTEFIVTYGISGYEINFEHYAEDLLDWWEERNL
ncbi:MAG: hypothetical protein AAF487_08290 [Bacteroidota bacterium]